MILALKYHCVSNLLVRALATAFVMACVLSTLVLAPAPAYAAFNDVTDSYPAAQGLGTYDSPIFGSDLPDGAYKVTARTTSRMCIMYTNPADADARDSKEQAIVMVNGGSLTAVFYISKAYTHIHMGTAEEAASLTDDEGLDASAYIAGDPPEGYEPHMFAIPIDALNSPMTFAAYSGGDKGLENGVWYTREVVFGMSEAEYRQILEDARQQQEPEPEPQGDDSSQESDQSSDGQDSQAVLEPDNVNTSGGNQNDAAENSGRNGGADQATEPDQSDSQEQSGESSTAAQSVPQTGEMRGVKMNIVSPQELTVDIEIEVDDSLRDDKDLKRGLSPRQIIALVVVGLLIAGVLARVLVFHAGYERVDGPPSAPLSRAGGKKWKGPGSGRM